eukprot:GHVS01036986.1.p1 GENE.GHVS01036986.1~~GHVS01036986.1.p1  ORF type:complete len:159 (+),score=8.92 GHVS01036986.1:102-578(+)
MAGSLLVPSDIALLENRFSVGPRNLSLFERIGLMTMAPMYHFNYTKNDKDDIRAVLSKQYDNSSQSDVVEILRCRQESLSKKARAHNGLWVGTTFATGMVWYSLRHYDYKAKLIVLPFVAYGGAWIGRVAANGITGRWSEYKRNKELGELPAKVFIGS